MKVELKKFLTLFGLLIFNLGYAQNNLYGIPKELINSVTGKKLTMSQVYDEPKFKSLTYIQKRQIQKLSNLKQTKTTRNSYILKNSNGVKTTVSSNQGQPSDGKTSTVNSIDWDSKVAVQVSGTKDIRRVPDFMKVSLGAVNTDEVQLGWIHNFHTKTGDGINLPNKNAAVIARGNSSTEYEERSVKATASEINSARADILSRLKSKKAFKNKFNADIEGSQSNSEFELKANLSVEAPESFTLNATYAQNNKTIRRKVLLYAFMDLGSIYLDIDPIPTEDINSAIVDEVFFGTEIFILYSFDQKIDDYNASLSGSYTDKGSGLKISGGGGVKFAANVSNESWQILSKGGIKIKDQSYIITSQEELTALFDKWVTQDPSAEGFDFHTIGYSMKFLKDGAPAYIEKFGSYENKAYVPLIRKISLKGYEMRAPRKDWELGDEDIFGKIEVKAFPNNPSFNKRIWNCPEKQKDEDNLQINENWKNIERFNTDYVFDFKSFGFNELKELLNAQVKILPKLYDAEEYGGNRRYEEAEKNFTYKQLLEYELKNDREWHWQGSTIIKEQGASPELQLKVRYNVLE